MTGLWIAIVLLSMAVAGLLILPLVRRRTALDTDRSAFDLTVYKDQLDELERDRQRGLITETDAAAAKLEIERRILAAADSEDTAGTTGRSQKVFIGLSAIAVPAAAVAMYLALGSPQMPNIPYASRDIGAEQNVAAERKRAAEMGQLADRLAKRLAEEPNNTQGWILLGRSYLTMGRERDGVAALKKAYELAPLDSAVLVEYAEGLILINQSQVTEQARALLERALNADPLNPRARYYLALAQAQAGDVKAALQGWVDLRALSPADAPWLPSVERQIAAAAKDLGVDPASLSASAETLAMRPQPAPGPSREEMQAAAQMSDEDRAQMIRGMVQRLAEKMKENPNDMDGWRRLLRAYRVLGDEAKAAEVEARIRALDQAGATIPGPSREDMEAAAQMSGADRAQMIRGMVQRLAEKMKKNPNDMDGWRRLLRAYRVLGEDAKAAEVEARIKALEQ